MNSTRILIQPYIVFVCGDQSVRTSAPINPHAMRLYGERTGVLSGSQSAFMTAVVNHTRQPTVSALDLPFIPRIPLY